MPWFLIGTELRITAEQPSLTGLLKCTSADQTAFEPDYIAQMYSTDLGTTAGVLGPRDIGLYEKGLEEYCFTDESKC